jgi:geranylgeranyl diphosphate synthase, type I
MLISSESSMNPVASLERSLREAVGMLGEPIRGIVLYHCGLDNAGGAPSIGPSAPVKHGIIVMFLALSEGGSEEHLRKIRNVGIAGLLILGATLILDDICDGDTLRSGRPAAWTVYGTPAAMLAATSMITLAFELVTREPAHIAVEVTRLGASALREGFASQARELKYERNLQIPVSKALADKAALNAAPLAIACGILALCRGATEAEINGARTFGYHAGMMIALQDDWDDLWASSSVTERKPMTDLRRRKITPCVAFALQSSGPARDRLTAFYKDAADPDPDQLLQMRSLIEECGGRA